MAKNDSYAIQLLNEIDRLKEENERLQRILQSDKNSMSLIMKKWNDQIEEMKNCMNCDFFKEKKYQVCKDIKKNNTICCAFWEMKND